MAAVTMALLSENTPTDTSSPSSALAFLSATSVDMELISTNTTVSTGSESRSILSRRSSMSSMSSLSSLSSSEDEGLERKNGLPAKKRKRTKTTGKLRSGLHTLRIPNKEKMGDDGKEYYTAGMYWSEAGSALNPDSGLSSWLQSMKCTKQQRLPSSKSSVKHKRAKLPGQEGAEGQAASPPSIDFKSIATSMLLPLPVFFGQTLLSQSRSFRMPFDIIRDFYFDQSGNGIGSSGSGGGSAGIQMDEATRERLENSKIPPPYRKIPKNIYVERKPDKSEVAAICQCMPPSDMMNDESYVGCGETCINRLMQYSCDPKTCRLGEKCSNSPLGMQKGVPEDKKNGLKVIWTGNRGFGLKSMVDIRKGDFVMEYRGEIISRDESYRRVLTIYKGAKSYYFLDYDGHEVIDAGQRGNASRFINHSCGPNLQVTRWKLSDLEEYQMGIFALQDIKAGEELTYDYGWQDYSTLIKTKAEVEGSAIAPPELKLASKGSLIDSSKPTTIDVIAAAASSTEGESKMVQDPARQRCFCGASVCSGYLGGKKQKEKEKTLIIVKRKGKKHRRKAKKLGEEPNEGVANGVSMSVQGKHADVVVKASDPSSNKENDERSATFKAGTNRNAALKKRALSHEASPTVGVLVGEGVPVDKSV